MAAGDTLSVLSHGLIVTAGGSCDYPDEADVRGGVVYGDGLLTGTLGETAGTFDAVGEAVAARLTTALANTAAAGRVFPTLPTQDEPLPYVCYRRVGGGGGVNLHGRSGLQNYTYRVDVYAATEAGAESLLRAVNSDVTGLPGWADRANGVQGVFPADDADADVLDDATRAPGQSFSIWYEG